VFRVILHVFPVTLRNTCNITRVRVRRPRPPNTQSRLIEHLYSPRMVAEIKEGKRTDNKRTSSDVT